MKKKHKSRTCEKPTSKVSSKKSVYDFLGISPDILLREPKITILGDYLLEFYNHKGIIDITDTQIKINTKKAIYVIKGYNLFILGVTDDEIDISGTVISIERE